SQKGLLVLADPGVTLSSDVTVSNTAPQQQTLLRGFVWTSNNVVSGPAFLRLASCQGAVAVEAMSTPTPNFACAGAVFPCPKAVYATACAALMFRSCTRGGASSLDGCVATFEGCTLQDHNCLLCSVYGGIGPTYALLAARSTVQIAGSSVLGGR